ncbi:MAG TPA: hypothetical protein VFV38_31425 [Ktedonobacteraceae bacterium]|nr:hypothetical protein [Ktedonobacteraceae bacterium]
MQQFTSIQKIDSAILYGLEIASSISVVLLSVGVVASMSNTLTNGWLLGSNVCISRTWIISQTVAMDTGLIVSIVRSFTLARSKHWLQCSLYALLSVLLLSTTAIVSNIESIQQTLGITLEKAYTYSPIPLVWLVSMRSLCVILLIVAHAMKYVSADSSPDQTALVAASEAQTPTEQPAQPEPEIEITEEKPEQPKALPAPKKRTPSGDNLERVRVYMTEHEGASVRQVAKDLSLGISTANKWMRQVKPAQSA